MHGKPMPLSFQVTLAGFGIFVIGAALIVFAHFHGGWEAITFFACGLLTAAVGSFGALAFSILCTVTHPEWRRESVIAILLAVSLAVTLFLVARVA
jgi:hypothetical protein